MLTASPLKAAVYIVSSSPRAIDTLVAASVAASAAGWLHTSASSVRTDACMIALVAMACSSTAVSMVSEPAGATCSAALLSSPEDAGAGAPASSASSASAVTVEVASASTSVAAAGAAFAVAAVSASTSASTAAFTAATGVVGGSQASSMFAASSRASCACCACLFSAVTMAGVDTKRFRPSPAATKADKHRYTASCTSGLASISISVLPR
mmetsp:Transcript_33485/g.68478  ORF Transcript_33485/g.68478 Transcript_33485/m.68478 type:complete len:211 (+) Transcript_33485:584-1216(+)